MGGALLTEHDMANALAEARDALVEARIETASTKGELAAEVRRNADLLVALAKAEARADRLAAELAEARKPVLLRLVEALRRR